MGTLLKRVVHHNTWSVLGTLGVAVLGIVLSVGTIRLLGVAEAGFATAVLGLLGIGAAVGDLGLGNAAIRTLGDPRNNGAVFARETVQMILSVSLSTGLLGGLLLGILADGIITWTGYGGGDLGATTFLALTGAAFVFSQWSSSLVVVLEGAQRYDLRAVVLVGTLLIQCFAVLTGLWIHTTLVVLGSVNLAVAIIRAICLQIACRRIVGFEPLPRFRPGILKRHWIFSRWVYGRVLANTLMAGGDRVVLVSLFGSGQLPYYTMARKFFEVGHQTMSAPSGFLFPLLCSAGDRVRIVATELNDRTRWFIAAVAGWIFGGVLLMGPLLLWAVLGADFAAKARFPVLVFALVGFAHAQSIFSFYAALADGRSRPTFLYQLNCGGGSLLCMLGLGISGGFMASVAGQLWTVPATLIFLYREVPRVGLRHHMVSVLEPITQPSGFLLLACLVQIGSWNGLFSPIALAVIGILYGVLYFPLLCRLELRRDRSSVRVEALHRALGLLRDRVGGVTFPISWITGLGDHPKWSGLREEEAR